MLKRLGVAPLQDVGASEDEAGAAQQSKLNLVAAATRDRRKEKENMADFIAKKREMFLVQMSLDTKRAEIRKLEERAQQREEALRKLALGRSPISGNAVTRRGRFEA